MTLEPLIQLRNVVRQYDSFQLRVERLEIAARCVSCLLGPTGAGKSTLLRMIAAIEAPEEGSIHVRSVRLDTRELPLQVRRDITLVFQRPLLVAGSVRTNVQYGLKLRGTVRQSSHKVDKLLHRLGLERLADQSASTLSGGQVQLVALARALAVEPSILLLDEPTANLDPAHVALVEQTIIEDQQERGTTVIWTTHNLFQARRVAQRVGLLLNGQLIETASTQEFFESPSDPRTADFVLGKMIY